MDRPAEPPEMEDRILPWSQVKVISGLSRTTVWRLQKTGDFPASVQVSRNRVGWRQSDILAWRKSRLPRRLPEPVPAPPILEDKARRPAALTPRVALDRPARFSKASTVDRSSPPTAKRRKSDGCEGQTAFDF